MADSWKSMDIYVDDNGNGPLKDDKREAKEKMVLKKGKEKMVMEREVIIIEDTNDNPFRVTFDESSDDRALQL
ncbi:hypothetical protein Tco_0414286 [Tanacetum coccineum]